jgi:hypothetical protein
MAEEAAATSVTAKACVSVSGAHRSDPTPRRRSDWLTNSARAEITDAVDADANSGHLGWLTMAEVVLRVRLTGGDRVDVTYEEPNTVEEEQVVEHVISLLADDAGVLRSKHGDRLVVLFARGVAGFEVAPRGAVL